MVKRVGVIGGGQLAWMMADAAAKLGVELVIQTPKPDDPAVAIAADAIFAPVADATATTELSQHCEVITFENEFVDLEALLRLEQQGIRFYPSLMSIAPLLDKYHQRSYLRDRGLPTPNFAALNPDCDPSEWSPFQFPVVLKSRRLGYDGQGTFIVQSLEALRKIIAEKSVAAKNSAEKNIDKQKSDISSRNQDWLIEEFVAFDRELAVMAARSSAGEVIVYPVVETQQERQVCQRVIVTRGWDESIVNQVESIARNLLNSLDFVGVMGIEFFLTRDGKILVNETAPRTHNSGHYSLDACETSQFEQQLRAVCNLPLGNALLTCAGAVMVNLLGYETAENNYVEKRQQLAQFPQAHLYWYGKSVSRPGRKLGHVTVLLEVEQGRQQALEIAKAIESIWYSN